MPRFLIVDDEEANLYMLRVLLEGHGHQVDEAVNGAEALEHARANLPDVVVSDLLMPVMDGFALCHEWKKDPDLGKVPFIVYTATYVDKKDEEAAFNAGADRFLRKPTEPDKFMEIMDEVLERAGETDAVRSPEWENESSAFKLYNERLVKKLEKKMHDLEREVEEHKRTEEELRSSEARLANAQAIARVGDWVWDMESGGFRISGEAARILGAGAAGREIATLDGFVEAVHPAERELVRQALASSVGRDRPLNIEHRVRRPDESERLVREVFEHSPDEEGKPGCVAGTIQDITEFRELERRVHTAQKLEAVGRLAGGVAHDFNNILHAVITQVDAVRMGMQDSDPRFDGLTKALQASQRAIPLVQQLLAIGRRQRLRQGKMDLNRMIREAAPLMCSGCSDRIELVTELDDDLGSIDADPDQIERVLWNLCLNAIDAIDDRGRITITTERRVGGALDNGDPSAEPEDWVVMSVRDTGCGFDVETRSMVFEPFFTTKEEGKGTGLGLSTAYGIVGQHRGRIEVESEVGKGSVFQVFLPAAE